MSHGLRRWRVPVDETLKRYRESIDNIDAALVFMLVAPREGIAETSIGCGPYAKDMFR